MGLGVILAAQVCIFGIEQIKNNDFQEIISYLAEFCRASIKNWKCLISCHKKLFLWNFRRILINQSFDAASSLLKSSFSFLWENKWKRSFFFPCVCLQSLKGTWVEETSHTVERSELLLLFLLFSGVPILLLVIVWPLLLISPRLCLPLSTIKTTDFPMTPRTNLKEVLVGSLLQKDIWSTQRVTPLMRMMWLLQRTLEMYLVRQVFPLEEMDLSQRCQNTDVDLMKDLFSTPLFLRLSFPIISMQSPALVSSRLDWIHSLCTLWTAPPLLLLLLQFQLLPTQRQLLLLPQGHPIPLHRLMVRISVVGIMISWLILNRISVFWVVRYAQLILADIQLWAITQRPRARNVVKQRGDHSSMFEAFIENNKIVFAPRSLNHSDSFLLSFQNMLFQYVLDSLILLCSYLKHIGTQNQAGCGKKDEIKYTCRLRQKLSPIRSRHLAPWFPWNLEMRKLSNCNKNNLLDNPGKILISNLKIKTYKLKPGNCQSCQQFPSRLLILHGLQVSAKDIRMNERNTLSFWVLKCLVLTPERNSLFLSLRLSHIKRIIPLLSVWFVFFSSLWFAKQRVSEEIPYFALERQLRWEERWRKKNGKKTITNGNQKCKIHNSNQYLILLWRYTSNQKNHV